jgi:hypothetical protein
MLIAEKIISKQFKAKTMKQAYLECCKWISTNIIAKNTSLFFVICLSSCFVLSLLTCLYNNIYALLCQYFMQIFF